MLLERVHERIVPLGGANIAETRDLDEGITPFFSNWLVPLQSGGRGRPVFVFPSGDNEPRALASEREIAQHASRTHPFWAFARDPAHLNRVRERGVAELAREYITHMRAIQGKGPFLLYGNCIGGYLAWETASQLLDAGEEIAGMFFYEVPLRADYNNVLPGHPPVHSANLWRMSHYYRPIALPVDLTHVVTETWHARGWWAPWQELVLGFARTVIIPNRSMNPHEFLARRQAIIARHVRSWVDEAEARIWRA